jgi:hypothetical protein
MLAERGRGLYSVGTSWTITIIWMAATSRGLVDKYGRIERAPLLLLLLGCCYRERVLGIGPFSGHFEARKDTCVVSAFVSCGLDAYVSALIPFVLEQQVSSALTKCFATPSLLCLLVLVC